MNVGVIELVHYEEWILSLGADREWRVQAGQARLMQEAHAALADAGAFFVPYTVNQGVAICNGILREKLEAAIYRIAQASPVPFRFSFRSAPTVTGALELAYSAMEKNLPKWGGEDNSALIAAHYDLDSYLETVRSNGLLYAKKRVDDLIGHVTQISSCIGGLSMYLGGDNVIMFSHLGALENIAGSVPDGAKVGIGIGRVPRQAVKRAGLALTEIRKRRNVNALVVQDG